MISNGIHSGSKRHSASVHDDDERGDLRNGNLEIDSAEDTKQNVSPPTKKSKPADFLQIVKRSTSISENEINIDFMKPKEKVINDSIHGHITLPAVAVAIMDTQQFQRLRFLKQVGTCHFVYPNATHTRFQHSLGVGHLAYKFAESLKKQNPDLVTEKDCICVMIAGLCHDLGHGPFSHLWEGFVHEANPESTWCHEDSSIKMLDYLIEDNNLMPTLKELGGLNEKDILFIKEQIAGPIDYKTGLTLKNIPRNDKEWRYLGRTEDKSFLYEIVANKISGIDVDKWDYLIRDNFYLNIGCIFKYDRFISYSKVIKTGDPERRRICIRAKEAELLYDMFTDRARLHKKGYQHRVTKVIDRMLVDAWLLADKHLTVKGSNGKVYTLSEACEDITAHEKLTDEIFTRIKDSDDPELEEARKILQRILKRQFYKSIASVNVEPNHVLRGRKAKDIQPGLQEIVTELSCIDLKPSDLIVLQSKVSMGMGDRNPMLNVTFYNKNEKVVHNVDSLNISSNLPDALNFETLHIVCKSQNPSAMREAVRVKDAWMDKFGFSDGEH